RTLGYIGGRGTGVDPNATSVAIARQRGLDAFTPDELPADRTGRIYDSLLCSHVLEHLPAGEQAALLGEWLPLVRPGGRVVLICPQERGFASDATHVTFLDGPDLDDLCTGAGLVDVRVRSFPLPRPVGRWWAWNETVVVATVR